MFEGKPPLPADLDAGAHAAPVEDQLRALSWPELIARLAAARDLQAALMPAPQAQAASFDSHSANHIAAMQGSSAKHDHESVNLLDSANRKYVGGKKGSSKPAHLPVTRGNT